MLEKDQIIVLHTQKYGESGNILQSYSKRYGRQSYMLNKISREKIRSIKPHLHPLSVLDIDCYSNQTASFKYIREITPSVKLNSIRSDILKYNIALFISELLHKTLNYSTSDEQMYDWIYNSVLALEREEEKWTNFHLFFAVSLCSSLGFMPKSDYSHTAPYFEIQSGGFICNELPDNACFSRENSELLYLFLTHDYDYSMMIRTGGGQRFSFLESVIRYLEHHLGCKLNIKSHYILHEILHD